MMNTTKVKIRNGDLEGIYGAVSALEPPDQTVVYKLDPMVRLALARSMKRVLGELVTVQTVRQQLIEQGVKNGSVRVEHLGRESRLLGDGADAVASEIKTLMEGEIELELHPVTTEDLNLKENQIPIRIIASLLGNIVSDGEAQ